MEILLKNKENYVRATLFKYSCEKCHLEGNFFQSASSLYYTVYDSLNVLAEILIGGHTRFFFCAITIFAINQTLSTIAQNASRG